MSRRATCPISADIKGQESAKRALEVAAAGGHNLLMVGPPGSGKSMLAQRLPSILPPLAPKELLEVSMIASVAGELGEGKLTDRRPFRAPHHSASMAAMVGGGLRVRPGEVSLAHHGVLFLDEFPEFTPQTLDALRQPLETGDCMIARANHRVTYPARIQLVAAMNPCRCGMAGEPGYRCLRGERCRTDYQARISGPLLDRIDLRIEVPAVSAADLIRPDRAEKSAAVALRVARARTIQRERFERLGVTSATTNAHCSPSVIEDIAMPDAAGLSLLQGRQRKARLFRARLSPRAESGAHAGRPRRQRDRRPHPSRRSDFLPHDVGARGAGGVRLVLWRQGFACTRRAPPKAEEGAASRRPGPGPHRAAEPDIRLAPNRMGLHLSCPRGYDAVYSAAGKELFMIVVVAQPAGGIRAAA